MSRYSFEFSGFGIETKKRSTLLCILKKEIVSRADSSPTNFSLLKTASPMSSEPFSPSIGDSLAFTL